VTVTVRCLRCRNDIPEDLKHRGYPGVHFCQSPVGLDLDLDALIAQEKEGDNAVGDELPGVNAQAFAAREAIEAGLWDRHLSILAAVIRARMRTDAWLHPRNPAHDPGSRSPQHSREPNPDRPDARPERAL